MSIWERRTFAVDQGPPVTVDRPQHCKRFKDLRSAHDVSDMDLGSELKTTTAHYEGLWIIFSLVT